MSTQAVKFVDLAAQYVDVIEQIIEGMRMLIVKGSFVGGDALHECERRLSTLVGTKHVVGCSDGTAALKLALLGAGIDADDEVIVPANSYIASANAVVHAGGRPFFVDCDPQTYLIDMNQVEDRLQDGGTRFVIPVHLYGNPCKMDELVALCAKWGAEIIEDNAQALGATFHGKATGGYGRAAGVSFYPAKNLGAFGQGGAVFTDDGELARRVRIFAEQGSRGGDKRYHHDVIGYNDRLDTLQAHVLRVMIEKLDAFNSARREAAGWYAEELDADRVQKPTSDSAPVYHLFTYRCDDQEHRKSVAASLQQAEIGFGFHYPVPIHKQKAYAQFNQITLPVCERLADTLISLPMHPFLTREAVQRVCDAVASA